MPHSSTTSQPAASRSVPGAAPQPRLLIVPGFRNSSAEHWQSVWERERADCMRAELGLWHDPEPERWVAALDRVIRSTPGDTILVAHSLGCIAVALWARDSPPGHHVVGALLVAPCDPEARDAMPALRRFAPVPRSPLPFAATVVASSNDAYATTARSCEMARAWGADFINVGAKGHINADSGLGAWQEGQILAAELVERARLSSSPSNA